MYMKIFRRLLHALGHSDLKYYGLEAYSFVFAVEKLPDPPPLTTGFGARLFNFYTTLEIGLVTSKVFPIQKGGLSRRNFGDSHIFVV